MIGKKYTENGGADMENQIDMCDVKDVQQQATQDKGLIAFEKYVGRINWLHPEEAPKKLKGRKYIVLNGKGEVVFESRNISNIAKEFGLSVSRVTSCINSVSLMKGEYLVERCGDE